MTGESQCAPGLRVTVRSISAVDRFVLSVLLGLAQQMFDMLNL